MKYMINNFILSADEVVHFCAEECGVLAPSFYEARDVLHENGFDVKEIA